MILVDGHLIDEPVGFLLTAQADESERDSAAADYLLVPTPIISTYSSTVTIMGFPELCDYNRKFTVE